MDTQLTEASLTLLAGMLTKYAMNGITAWWPKLEGKKIVSLTVPVALVLAVPILMLAGVTAAAAVVFAIGAALQSVGFNEAVKTKPLDAPAPTPPVGGAT